MRPTLFALLIFVYGSLSAQNDFQKLIGGSGEDRLFDVVQQPAGFYTFLGYTESEGHGAGDELLIRTNEAGDTLWTKVIGTIDNEEGLYLRGTADGGYIIGGTAINSSTNIVLLTKTDSSGNITWNKNYYANTGATYNLGALSQCADGGYIVGGFTSDHPSGTGLDVFVFKTDGIGNLEWNSIYGGIYDDYWGIPIQTADSGFLVAGTYGGSSSEDVYLVKLDSIGDTLWTKKFDIATKSLIVADFVQTADGNYLIGANISFPRGYVAIKIDSAGNVFWAKEYGSSIKSYNGCFITPTADDGFLLSGTYYSGSPNNTDAFLVRIDANGDTLWTKKYGGNYEDALWGTSQTTDGGFMAAGLMKNSGFGLTDGWVVKMDSLGNSGGCNLLPDSVPLSDLVLNSSHANTIMNSHLPSYWYYTPPFIRGIQVATTCAAPVFEIPNENSADVFPVPSNDEVNIRSSRLKQGRTYALTVYDVNGKIARTVSFEGSGISLRKQDLAPGIYFWTITGENEMLKGRFILE
ncbi:MAG TPA: T9SS type A sorting domain-containing protein [Bacteroidia bacterium]|jgi:hypothetical protein|nr:T9SS type A sorting domain-containing protein [Bacteroidia bacterium]